MLYYIFVQILIQKLIGYGNGANNSIFIREIFLINSITFYFLYNIIILI